MLVNIERVHVAKVELSCAISSLLKCRVGGWLSKDQPLDLLQNLQNIQCAVFATPVKHGNGLIMLQGQRSEKEE